MNVKNFIIGTIAGFISYNILGYIFYQVLFPNLYPSSGEPNMMMVTLGCLFGGMLYAFIYAKLGGAGDMMSAATNGAGIGGLNAIAMNCFMYSNMPMNMGNLMTDVFINLVMGVVTSILIWFAVSKFGSSN